MSPMRLATSAFDDVSTRNINGASVACSPTSDEILCEDCRERGYLRCRVRKKGGETAAWCAYPRLEHEDNVNFWFVELDSVYFNLTNILSYY